MKRLMRTSDVMEFTGFSRQHIYRLMDKNEFPRPVKIGKNTNAWLSEDLDDWLTRVVEATRHPEGCQGGQTSLAS